MPGATAVIMHKRPKTIRWELKNLHNAGTALVDTDSPGVQALAKALETVWGKRPYFKREGGSIGAVILLKNYVGAESILSGFGLPDDALHAPNEKFYLPNFYRGIESIIRFFQIVGGAA